MTIKASDQVDEHHQLHAQVPASVAPGRVKVILFVPKAREDEAEQAWEASVAREWIDELRNVREDIYSMGDGEPIDESRLSVPGQLSVRWRSR
jgi:hypothetical protein